MLWNLERSLHIVCQSDVQGDEKPTLEDQANSGKNVRLAKGVVR
jgi:hypothetical protein